VLVAACSDAGGDRAGRFCAAVREDQAVITTAVQDAAQVGDVVDRFRALERTAPLAIEQAWSRLTELVELAADLDPADLQARTRLVAAAYESEGDVQQVVTWVRGTCGVDLTVPAPATTVATGPATSQP
jgi:hypothetical protein